MTDGTTPQKASWARALAVGTAVGLGLAVLDSLLAAFIRSVVVLDRGPGLIFHAEAIALAVFVPLGLASILALRLVLGGKYFDRFAVPAAAGGAAWLGLMSMAPPQHARGLIIYGAVFALAAAPAGFGVERLVRLAPDLSPGKSMMRSVVVCLAALSSINLLTALFAANQLHLFIKVPLFSAAVAASVMGLILLIRRFHLLKGSSIAAVAAGAILIAATPYALLPRMVTADPVDAATSPDEPTVVLIVADALRYDALSPERTPNLWKLRRESVDFQNAQSAASWTQPAVTALFSARDPERLRTGITYNAPPEVPSLAEDLTERGYQTIAVIANRVIDPNLGILRGFQKMTYFDHMPAKGIFAYLPIFSFLDHYTRLFLNLPTTPETTARVTNLALKSLHPEVPQFLYLHYMDPHDPYSPPEQFRPTDYHGFIRFPFDPRNSWHVAYDMGDPQIPDLREGRIKFLPPDKLYIAGLYLGEVAYLDQQIGRLLKSLENLAQQRPLILVFTSDHGEELWDHDDWGHGNSMYQELLHVPLLIQAPGLDPQAVSVPVSSLSLMPTLRELLKLGPDAGADAQSLLSYGIWTVFPNTFSSQNVYHDPRTALRKGSDKIIHDLADDSFTYFNLAEDPREQDPQPPPESAQPLVQMLRQHEKDMTEQSFHKTVSRDLDAAAARRLKAVGYIQ